MATRRSRTRKLGNWLARLLGRRQPPAPEIAVAMQLIAAIDAGGIPLNPARVNAIARNLGLEVSTKAPVEETLGRIRAALERAGASIPE